MSYYKSNEYLQKFGSSVQKNFMDIGRLYDIIGDGENLQTEFKLKVKFPEKIVNEVVAFANTKGGFLCIGVDDFGSVKGVKFPEDEEFELVRAIEKFCKPLIDFSIFRVRLPDLREVLVFEIQESLQKPVYLLEEGKEIAYVRVADKSIKASKAFLKIIKGRQAGVSTAVSIGEKEQILFKHLEVHQTADVTTFAEIAHLPTWLASNILVRLVLANVLVIYPDDTADLFAMATQ
jgi:predicted HTH transcriptional regulator